MYVLDCPREWMGLAGLVLRSPPRPRPRRIGNPSIFRRDAIRDFSADVAPSPSSFKAHASLLRSVASSGNSSAGRAVRRASARASTSVVVRLDLGRERVPRLVVGVQRARALLARRAVPPLRQLRLRAEAIALRTGSDCRARATADARRLSARRVREGRGPPPRSPCNCGRRSASRAA